METSTRLLYRLSGLGLLAGGLLLTVAAPLLAIAALRARVLPAWPAVLLLVFAGLNVLSYFPVLPGGIGEKYPVLFYLAMAGFGLTLLPDRIAESRPVAGIAPGK